MTDIIVVERDIPAQDQVAEVVVDRAEVDGRIIDHPVVQDVRIQGNLQ